MIGTDNQLLTEPVQTLPLAARVSLVGQDGSAAEFTLRLSADLNMLSTRWVHVGQRTPSALISLLFSVLCEDSYLDGTASSGRYSYRILILADAGS